MKRRIAATSPARGSTLPIIAALAALLPLALSTAAHAQTYSSASGPITTTTAPITVTNTGSITNPGGAGAVAVSGTTPSLTNDGTISAGAYTIQVGSGGTLTTLQNNATITSTSAGGDTINVYNGTFGTVNNAAGATISGPSNVIDVGAAGTIGALNNAGTITGATGIASSGTLTAITNQSGGLITGTSGYGIQTGNAVGSFTNQAGGTVSGTLGSFNLQAANSGAQPGMGSFNNAGTMTGGVTIAGANQTVNLGSFTNSGTITGGVLLQGNNAEVGTLGNVSNTGTITGSLYIGQYTSTGTMSNSGSVGGLTMNFTTAKSFTNTGTITGTMNLNTSTSTTINGGSGASFGVLNKGTGSGIRAQGSVTLTGNNQLNENIATNLATNSQGTVTNNGTLQLTGKETITGLFTQTAGADLDLIFAGSAAGQYGNLTSTLAATLLGTLSLETTGGFSFAPGQTFDVMNFASHSGDFSGLNMNGAACASKGADAWDCSGLLVTEVFSANGQQLDLVISQVPEPASMAIFGIALAGLGAAHRRRKA